MSPGSRRGRLPSPCPGSPGHAPCSLRRAPSLGGSCGLADPPAAAQAPVLRSSSLRRRLPRQSLPARGCSRGWDRSGSRRPSLRPQPSPPPLRQPLRDRLLRLGSLRGGEGRGRENGAGGRGRGGSWKPLPLPPKFWALSQNPGVKVNFLPRSPFPSGRKRKGKEGHSGGEGEVACFQGPGLSLRSSRPTRRLEGLPGEPGPVPLPLSRKGLSEGRVGRAPGNSGLETRWAGDRNSTASRPPSLGTARRWQAAQTLLKPPRLEGPPRPSFQTGVVYESPF